MKYGWDTELNRQPLQHKLNLATLDGRSQVSHVFTHKIEVNDYDTIMKFIDWGIENLGTFCPYEIFCDNRSKDRTNAKWLIKTLSGHLGEKWVEFYIKKQDLPLVLLCWKE